MLPQLPVTDSENLRHLPPSDLLRQSPQNHCLNFHRPLLSGCTIVAYVASDMDPCHAPPQKRTFHLLIEPGMLNYAP